MPDFNRKIFVGWQRVDAQRLLGRLRQDDDANVLLFE
jgi:hypothetical protein